MYVKNCSAENTCKGEFCAYVRNNLAPKIVYVEG